MEWKGLAILRVGMDPVSSFPGVEFNGLSENFKGEVHIPQHYCAGGE